MCVWQAHEKSSFQCEPLFQVSTSSSRTLPSADVAAFHFGVKSLAYLHSTAELCVTTADNALIYFDV